MAYLALAAVGLVGVLALMRLFVSASPATLANGIRWLAFGVAGAAALGALVTGRIGLVIGLATLLLPWWMQWKAARNRAAAAAGPSRGGSSRIRTDWLEAELDHETGALTGRVVRGALADRRLEALDRAALVGLIIEIGDAEPASSRILETVLDRRFPDWRDAAATPPPSRGAMTRTEAFRILGLEEGATAADITAAHRRLMMANHPDRGGSAYLAAQINEARRILTQDGMG